MVDAAVDAERMQIALELALRGWGQTAPNPLVGAVIFNGDEKVGEGYHERFAGPHAEAMALADAGEKARGGTLYVNLEPCNHHGRNPPCSEAIIAAGIKRVVVSIRDPNPVAAGGAERLRNAGIEVSFGAREKDGRETNAVFLNRLATDRPWVTLKLALSLDGSISGPYRSSGWLTGDESREVVQHMRAQNEAIAVGVQTALADDPRLIARTNPSPRIPAVRIVFDRSARLSPASFLAQTARDVPTVVVTAETTRLPDELENVGVASLPAHDIGEALRILKKRGIGSMMVEGGAGLAASFLAGGYVDRLVIFRAPIILGNGSLGAFSGVAGVEIEHAARFDLIASRCVGQDVMTTYGARIS